MTDFLVTEHPAQPTAGVRETVPTDRLPEFFARAFHATMNAVQAQGVQPAGPPFGKYYGMPTDIVDVEAGFPVSRPIRPDGQVVAGELPAGRIVEAVHIGPYDTLQLTYGELERFIADQGLNPGEIMWESYLSDPEREPDPATWRTLISRPVA